MLSPTSIQRLQKPALGLLVLLLLAVSAAMIWGMQSFADSARWVGHTYEVISKIETVRSSVREVESSARGYRLTGLPGLRAEYMSSRPVATGHVRELLDLVRTSKVQSRRGHQLAALVDARIAEVDSTVVLYREGRSNDAIEAMRGGRGLRLMDEVDSLADAMREEEERLLADRRVDSMRKAALLTGFIIAGMLISFVMLGTLVGYLSRDSRRSRALEQKARATMATLERSLAERETLAEQRRVLSAFAGLLHSCQTSDEALSVAANALSQLIPNGSGVCYLMRSSQNLLEMRTLFGTRGSGYPETIRPDQCWALRRGSMHVFDPDRPSAACEHLHGLDDNVLRGACVPLAAQGAVLGLMHVSGGAGEPLDELERAAAESVAEHLAVVLHSLELRETLRVQSLRDPLTGLYNRRYLEESLPRDMERCQRRGRPLSALMVDIDFFKRFNDEHGHPAGDALLARVGQLLGQATRDEDIACRLGGEEFAIVMPEADGDQAAERAEQLRLAVSTATVTYMRRELGPVTVSIGVAELGDGVASPQALLAAADRALYSAKARGRDRVERAGTQATP